MFTHDPALDFCSRNITSYLPDRKNILYGKGNNRFTVRLFPHRETVVPRP